MKKKSKKQELYQFLYLLFWGISFTFFLMFLILFILYYFTEQRSVVTFSHLFSLAFLLGASGICVLLGNHFHLMTFFVSGKQTRKLAEEKKERGMKESPRMKGKR